MAMPRKYLLVFLTLAMTMQVHARNADSLQIYALIKTGSKLYKNHKDSAIGKYRLAIDLSDSKKYMDDSLAKVKVIVANYEYYRGRTSEAIRIALNVLDYYRFKNNMTEVVQMLSLIGDILRGNNFYDQSYIYLNEARLLAYKSGDSVLIAHVLNRMAATFYEDPAIPRDSTEKYSLTSLGIAHRAGVKGLIYKNLNILGALETRDSNYRKSLNYLEEALPVAQEVFPEDEALVLINIARNYYLLNDLSKAESICMHALELARYYNIPQYTKLVSLNLEEIYLKKGDYRNAHKYCMLYYQSKEAIRTQKVLVQLQDFNSKLAAEKQYNENQRLLYNQKLDKKLLQDYMIIGILLILLLVCAVIFLVYLNRQRTKIRGIAAKLDQSNTILKRFISILGHDLRSPFNAILGFTDLLKNEPDLTKADREKYTEMLSSVSHSTFKLLERILEWSQLQSGAVKPVKSSCNLTELTAEVTDALKPVAHLKNIELRQNSKDQVLILADPDMITTAIRNLVSNAIKFTQPGGLVEVTVFQNHREVKIEIQDNGIGIEKENLGKLFRLDENYRSQGTKGEQGTGLGLILCREYIQMHEGDIQVESEPGKGSRFMISLPA